MPQPFNSSVMTDSGAALLTKAQAGECKIQFTRVAIGNGEYTDEEKTTDALKVRTELKDEKNSYSINDLQIYNEHCVKLSALFTNQDPMTGESIVDEGYYINEIGLFAREADGSADTEVLYSIAVVIAEHGDFMPAYSGANLAQIVQNFFVTVNNSADVVVEDAGALVTVTQMENAIKSMFTDIYPVGSIYMSINDVSPATLFGGTWEQIEDTFLLASGSSHQAGETGGEEAVALSAEQIPSHTHSLPSHTHSMPSHTHSIPALSGTAASAGSHAHTVTTGAAGRQAVLSGTSYAAAYGPTTWDTSSSGSHTHSVTTNSSTTGSTSGTSGSASGTSGAAGGGEEHDNMPPYLAVYMWKRVA